MMQGANTICKSITSLGSFLQRYLDKVTSVLDQRPVSQLYQSEYFLSQVSEEKYALTGVKFPSWQWRGCPCFERLNCDLNSAVKTFIGYFYDLFVHCYPV